MQPYKPQLLPIEGLDFERLLPLAAEANRYLAHYSGRLENLHNPNILLTPFTNQEAVLSSKIEGTHATLTDIYEEEGGEKTKDERKRGDIEEIINYRLAMYRAKTFLNSKSLSLNSIKGIHRTLMQGVRGEKKNPGEFRKHQVHIGNSVNIEDARFVPPSPNTDMLHALDNWEKYVHLEGIEPLIQLAIIHAQFEIIHPFGDGNGRMGRILIPVFLYFKEYLREPAFYMSEYLENNRQSYYDSLLNITKDGNWTAWIEFFLKGIILQSKKNTIKIKEIEKLYNDTQTKIEQATHSQYIKKALDAIFKQPIVQTNVFVEVSKIPKASAIVILSKLVDAGILKVKKGIGSKPSTYMFADLVNVVEGKEVI